MRDDCANHAAPPTSHAHQQRQRLGYLLGLPAPIDTAATLTPADFTAWKPLIERAAFNHHPDVVEMADLVEHVAQATGSEMSLAVALWTSGNVYFVLDQPSAAIKRLEAAESLFRAHHDELAIARLSVGKVSALDKLGRYEEAIACGRRMAPVLAASDDEADQRRLVGLYNGIGISSEHLGRYAEALDSYRKKWQWWQQQPGETAQIQAARALINMGVVQTRLGLYLEAIDVFDQARDMLVRAPPDGQVLADIARVDMNVAWLETVRQSPPDVVQTAFERARASRGAAPDASTDLALLDLFEAEWRARSALWAVDDLVTLQDIRWRCAETGLVDETARADLALSRWLLDHEDAEAALQGFAQVIDAASERGDIEIAYLGLLGQAQAHRQKDDLPAARVTLEAALNLVERTRHQLVVDEFRAGFVQNKLAAYHELASIWLATGNAEQALQTTERAKARTLTELLQAKPGQQADGEEASARARVLESEVHSLRSQLARHVAAGSDAGQRAVEKQITDLTRQIAQAAPRYASEPSAHAFPIENIISQLPADTLAIAYAVVHDDVWVFLLDANGLLGQPLLLEGPPRQDALHMDMSRIGHIARLPRASADRWLSQQVCAAQAPLARWHRQYLAPFRSHLERYESLLIVPDGLLNLLPFAAFYDEATGRYVAQDHTVTVTPSLATWRLIQGQHGRAGQGVCATGYSSGGRLPHAAAEPARIARMLPGATVLLEEAATRQAFSRCAGAADLVVISSHGVYRSDAPAFSYLELADGRLEAYDITRLTLQASAVVLSACETGTGQLTGNELMGLVRGFLYAGARAVAATYWAVDDQAMAALMDELLRGLSAGQSLAEALALAQRRLIDRAVSEDSQRWLAHPFYWGALAVVGVDGHVQL